METQVLVYGREDLKKSGGFKKKFNVNWISKEEFFKYLKENKWTINSDYIDITGNISNGKRFRCSYGGMVIGTSGLVKEFTSSEVQIKLQEDKK